ncbi:hypothetical protein [Paenibacillus periandrae]|uniref:hypothetical protein n=1 Tax=Paenibacillus periandrae TaxID=1761741 RepID=UPI001F08CDB5|nr:hypothetical protein [Paenibacillus periandrae]
MNSKQKEDFHDRIKIGARVLGRDQVPILLPSYEKLHEQVKGFRKQAAGLERWDETSWLHKYKRDFRSNFDNVISILGERGSGKTSVLLTFKYFHTKQFSEQDIVLPLIVPDQMSGASDTLGWVLGFLHGEMKEIERIYHSEQERTNQWRQDAYCGKGAKSQLEKKYKELQKAYLLRQDSYAAIIRKRDEGVQEHISDNEKIVNSDQNLIDHFHDFIDILVNYKKMIIKDKNHEPLILIFFDDVDISAKYCMEILNTVRTFFSHPNIIVFVSGAYSVFIESVTLNMLDEEKVDARKYDTDFVAHWEESKTALVRRLERSREFLKKVFPPAFRYDMKNTLSDQEKADFKYYVKEGEDHEDAPSFMNLLSGITAECSNETCIGSIFDKEKIQIPQAYFRIFDSNPRGLISPYYFLYLRRDKVWSGLDVQQFLDIIINSNKELAEYKTRIKDLIKIYFNRNGLELETVSTFIDYSKLEVYELPKAKEGEASNVKREFEIENHMKNEISILLLADLFEKLLRLFHPKFQVADHVKTKPLVSLLNNLYGPSLFPYMKTMEGVLGFYNNLSTILSMLGRNRSLFNPQADSHYIERQYLKAVSRDQDEYKTLRKLYREDKDWVTSLVKYISSVGRSDEEIMRLLVDEARAKEKFLNDVHYHSLIIKLDRINSQEVQQRLARNLKEGNMKVVTDHQDLDFDDIQNIVSYIHLAENRALISVELHNKGEILKEKEQNIRVLEQSRWLKRKQSSVKKTGVDLVSIIENKIHELERKIMQMKREGEARSLIKEYFHEDEVTFEGEDFEAIYNGIDFEKDFISRLDEEELHFTSFNPVLVLKEYVDIHSAKQLVKKEELEFIGLCYDEVDEKDNLTLQQKKLVRDFFAMSKEKVLLELLLPKGRTTGAENLQQLKNEQIELRKEINILRAEDLHIHERNTQIMDKLVLNDKPLSDVLREWEMEKSSRHRLILMKELNVRYIKIQNQWFNKFYISLVKEHGFQNSAEAFGGLTNFQRKAFLIALEELLEQFVGNHRTYILNQPKALVSLWEDLTIRSEIEETINLIPSVKNYILVRYALEMIRIEEDEQADGSIGYFRNLKLQLKLMSNSGYSSFDLHLKNILGSKREWE